MTTPSEGAHSPEDPISCPELGDQLTVEAWVDGTRNAPESMQVLVSKWRPPDVFGEFAAHDAGCVDGLNSTGYFGAVFDGQYVYFVPGMHGDASTHGNVLRLDTRADFHDPGAYAAYDASLTDGPFDDPSSWEAFDATAVGMGMNVGAVFDGTHLYFCAYRHSRIARFDTRGELSDPAYWQSRDVDDTGGLRTCGFDGGFFDGRFVYFQPFIFQSGPGKRDVTFHCNYLRYDASQPFDEAGSWQACDASMTDGLPSVGYNGGAFDGRYLYAAPWQQGPDPQREGQFSTHGIVLRCDTLGEHGSFSLRYGDYGHNGGLNAAVPGPSFVINTDQGALSVAAHEALPTGRHHLAGTYDGREIRLFVDGQVAARRQGRGQIARCEEPVVLGRMQDGLGQFHGDILQARVDGIARSEGEIRERAHGGS